MKVKETYSTLEVATMLGKSEDQLRYAIRSSKIPKPVSRHGGTYAWTQSEFAVARDVMRPSKRLPWEALR